MGGDGDDRGRDGWMASLTQWTWVWVNSKSGEGQGGLVCCSPWDHKESDMTEWLNNKNQDTNFYFIMVMPGPKTRTNLVSTEPQWTSCLSSAQFSSVAQSCPTLCNLPQMAPFKMKSQFQGLPRKQWIKARKVGSSWGLFPPMYRIDVSTVFFQGLSQSHLRRIL